MKFDDRKEIWYWAIVLGCLLTFAWQPFQTATNVVNIQYRDQTTAAWSATNVWIRSADCALRTGAWLTICNDAGTDLQPIASKAAADDPRHAFLLDVKAIVKKRAMTLLDVARLNISINYVGMAAIAIALLLLRAYAASFVWIAFAPNFFAPNTTLLTDVPSPEVSPHLALMGVAALAFLLPIAIASLGNDSLSRTRKALLIAAGLAGLSLASLIREPIGLMTVLVSLGTLLLIKFFQFRKLSNTAAVAVLLSVLFVSQTPHWVLKARDVIFSVPPTSMIQTHGISHNLYLGLGVVPNKFGIRWDDSYADKEVKAVDSSIGYVSPAYYKVLWSLYFKRVAQDPIEVIRIYLNKSLIVLQMDTGSWGPMLWIFFILLAVALPAIRRWRWDPALKGFPLYPVTAISLSFIGLFFLQGVMAHPGAVYARPIGVFVLLIIAVLLEAWGRRNLTLTAPH